MGDRPIHQCQCWECQEGNASIQGQHKQLNLLMSRLNEQQRRWMAALEAKRLGHGGTQRLSEITYLATITLADLDDNYPVRQVEEFKEDLAA